jgi:hypothetical protein
MSSTTCPDDCPTIGVEAQPLVRFRDIQPEDGGWIIYDDDAEDAWIQSDVYYPRANCV